MARFYWLARDGRGVTFFFCLDPICRRDIPLASLVLAVVAGFAGREDVCLGLVQLRWRSWRVVIGGWVGMVS
jgi:hypothetical protein